MAFRSSNVLTQAQALADAMGMAASIKGLLQSYATALAGNVTSDQVFQLVDNIRAVLVNFNRDAAVPNIAAYAQAQFNDSTYNVATEFTNMVNALNAVVSWVVTNFPKDAGGFIQAYTINADGSRSPASFTSAQTGGLLTAVNNAIATIT